MDEFLEILSASNYSIQIISPQEHLFEKVSNDILNNRKRNHEICIEKIIKINQIKEGNLFLEFDSKWA